MKADQTALRPLIRGAGSGALSPMAGCRPVTRPPAWPPEICPHSSVGESGQPLGDGKWVSATALGKQSLHGLTSLLLFFYFICIIYLPLAVLGLCGRLGFSLVAVSRGCSLAVACRLLIAAASPTVERRL